MFPYPAEKPYTKPTYSLSSYGANISNKKYTPGYSWMSAYIVIEGVNKFWKDKIVELKNNSVVDGLEESPLPG